MRILATEFEHPCFFLWKKYHHNITPALIVHKNLAATHTFFGIQHFISSIEGAQLKCYRSISTHSPPHKGRHFWTIILNINIFIYQKKKSFWNFLLNIIFFIFIYKILCDWIYEPHYYKIDVLYMCMWSVHICSKL